MCVVYGGMGGAELYNIRFVGGGRGVKETADEQCIRGVGTQRVAAVAVDASDGVVVSDGEPEPEEAPISKQVNKASVAELGPFQQSAPSKKAQRRAAQKAHRRAR